MTSAPGARSNLYPGVPDRRTGGHRRYPCHAAGDVDGRSNDRCPTYRPNSRRRLHWRAVRVFCSPCLTGTLGLVRQGCNDFARRSLQVCEVPRSKLLHGIGGLHEQDVDRPVYPLADRGAEQRSPPARRRTAVGCSFRRRSSGRAWHSPSFASPQNPLEPPWIAREPVLGLVRFAQPPDDRVALLVGAIRQIRPSRRRSAASSRARSRRAACSRPDG